MPIANEEKLQKFFEKAGELEDLYNEVFPLTVEESDGNTAEAPEDSGEDKVQLFPHADIYEDDDEWVVELEIPGIEIEDLEIVVEDDVLTITGEILSDRDDQDRFNHLLERFYGPFSREFDIPDDVDQDEVEATYSNGILTVVIPKQSEEVEDSGAVEVEVTKL